MARLSMADTARRLGVHERTIRRRLAAGTLTGEQIMSATGPRWVIDVPDEPVRDITIVETPERSAFEAAVLAELRAIRARLDVLDVPAAALALPEPQQGSGILSRIWDGLKV